MKREKEPGDDRQKELAAIWGSRKVTRLNKVASAEFCGKMTVREFAAVALADVTNFPKGLDTPLCIGDFEGNFCTNVLSITIGVDESHLCVSGDPHGGMS